ncbi:MAG TPA: FUSC family protein [Solirubrobacterales bacterium]|nr:FUSC family protein [Solirubrobacterales bacterium]
MTKTSQITLRHSRAGGAGQLFDPAGTAKRLRASPLFSIGPAAPGPALRRGALLSVPIAISLGIEFGFDAPTKGAIATGALLAGFPGMDAPAGPRAVWQAVAAPLIGIAAAVGILTTPSAPLAALALGLLGAAAGYCFSVSLRLAILGLSVSLALMVAQGLFLPTEDAAPALLWATVGALGQALWSLLVWLTADRAADDEESGWDWPAAKAALTSNLTLGSPNARHAIRFGLALAAGVALYRLLDMHVHGFWVPLTILFVMRTEIDETHRRLILRALGTVLGLVLATAAAEAFRGDDLVTGAILTASAGLAFGLLTVQYALFTAAITVYVVLLSDTLGEGAFQAADERATGTALGILIAFLAFAIWPNPGESTPNRGGGGEVR